MRFDPKALARVYAVPVTQEEVDEIDALRDTFRGWPFSLAQYNRRDIDATLASPCAACSGIVWPDRWCARCLRVMASILMTEQWDDTECFKRNDPW